MTVAKYPAGHSDAPEHERSLVAGGGLSGDFRRRSLLSGGQLAEATRPASLAMKGAGLSTRCSQLSSHSGVVRVLHAHDAWSASGDMLARDLTGRQDRQSPPDDRRPPPPKSAAANANFCRGRSPQQISEPRHREEGLAISGLLRESSRSLQLSRRRPIPPDLDQACPVFRPRRDKRTNWRIDLASGPSAAATCRAPRGGQLRWPTAGIADDEGGQGSRIPTPTAQAR